MKERPLLMTGPLVLLSLEGIKTNTLRVAKHQPTCSPGRFREIGGAKDILDTYTYGRQGDRLWIKENYRFDVEYDKLPPSKVPQTAAVWHEAGGVVGDGCPGGKLRPSIFMPRWASRLTVELLHVSVFPIQEVHPDNCRREGIIYEDGSYEMEWLTPSERDRRRVEDFKKLWDSINGKRKGCSWADNPWCWSLGYKRVQ